MVTVRTKEELKKAIESGETEIHVANKRLLAACWLASKIQHFSASQLAGVPQGILPAAVAAQTQGILPAGVVAEPIALGETTIIALAIIAGATAVAIVAICHNQGFEIEVDPEKNKIRLKTKK